MFSAEVTAAIKQHAVESFPNESCGAVVTKTTGEAAYLPLKNTANDPTQSFHIDERIVVQIMPSLLAIVHSHPNGPDCPSKTDMQQQALLNVPFGIVSTNGVDCLEPFYWGDTLDVPELVGRGFKHGVTDCYALVRDYFRVTLNVTLKEYPRDWEWWLQGESLYEQFFKDEGFHRINESEVKTHDCFLAQLRSPTPNHAGVYVGGGLVMHHLSSRLPSDPTRLSRRDPVGAWSRYIAGFWVRHESQDA